VAGNGNGSATTPSSTPRAESALLRRPLLLATRLSHTTAAYISLRRRRRWWGKAGGFPRVPVGEANALPEPAVELWHKVLPLGLLFSACSFNLTVLQSLKDAIMITAGGAETLPFLASFGVLPLSVVFFMYFNWLTRRQQQQKEQEEEQQAEQQQGSAKRRTTASTNNVFALAVAPLLAFYALFAWVLYPLAPALHPLALMERAMEAVPVPGLHGLFKMAGFWLYSLFFCSAELWGPVVISVLFWGLANDACTVDEAKSTYPLLAIGANVALIAAGAFIRAVNAWLPTDGAAACAQWLGCVATAADPSSAASAVVVDRRLLSLRVLVGAVLLTSGVMLAAKRYIDREIVEPRRRAEAAADDKAKDKKKDKKQKKKKGSLSESVAVLRACPKVRNLAALVIGYGLSHRLFEFCFKNTLRALYPTVEQYQGALADVASATGVTTLAFMFASRLIFRRFGWGVAAACTPIVMGAAGLAFFCASAALVSAPAASAGTAAAAAAATAATVAAAAGAVTQVFARSSKYSLFDPSKEMVFILMEGEERARGKAAIDLLAAQAGKTGASWLTSALLLMTGSIAAAVPYVGGLYMVVIGTWLWATRQLSEQMKEAEREQEQHAEEAAEAQQQGSSPSPSPGDAAAAAALSAAAAGNAAQAMGVSGAPAGHQNGNSGGGDERAASEETPTRSGAAAA
jgi:AAA family ATP:ADP antiporter